MSFIPNNSENGRKTKIISVIHTHIRPRARARARTHTHTHAHTHAHTHTHTHTHTHMHAYTYARTNVIRKIYLQSSKNTIMIVHKSGKSNSNADALSKYVCHIDRRNEDAYHEKRR